MTLKTPYAKPLLRGHFHQAAFFIALGACLMLLSRSHDLKSFISLLIYSLCLMGLFATSALYHRPNWSPKIRSLMKRLDHSAIFLLISGTITPISIIALPAEVSFKLLLITWLTTFLGIVQALFWSQAPKWASAIIYLFAGWLVVPYLPELKMHLDFLNVFFIFVGGIVYSLGAIIYASKWPNPSPKYFGYHEIFHLLVIIAAVFHFIVINRLANLN